MKWLVLILALAMPSLVLAADGATCTITPPTTVDAASLINNVVASCVDVCDKGATNGAITCGPIWLPIQNADSTTFTVYANAANCAFDTLDVAQWWTSTAPSGEVLKVFGTIDDDAGCGLTGATACHGVDVPYPIGGYVYLTSNAATVGGASCASFKVRMTQHVVRSKP